MVVILSLQPLYISRQTKDRPSRDKQWKNDTQNDKWQVSWHYMTCSDRKSEIRSIVKIDGFNLDSEGQNGVQDFFHNSFFSVLCNIGELSYPFSIFYTVRTSL